MIRIVVGMVHHETNTLTPLTTDRQDFTVVRGPAMLDQLAVTPLFRDAGAELIPTLYANALPSGKVRQEVYADFRDEILRGISNAGKVDGIWLYLHGAMEVEAIGNGEADLLQHIRRLVGSTVPIAVTLDFHGNIAPGLVAEANIICGYRTAPHTDQPETQQQAARLLLKCIREGLLPQPVLIHVPVLCPGDILVTTSEPGKSLMKELERSDARGDILCASIFGGQPWVDAPNVSMSVVVAASHDRVAAWDEARRLARCCWEVRKHFRFETETAEPEAALKLALESVRQPVFVSDSGDNTTGGAPGDSAMMLKLLLKMAPAAALVAGITDAEAVHACAGLQPGARVELDLGGSLHPAPRDSVRITGTLKFKGNILGWFGEDAGPAVVLQLGGIDVLVTEKRCGIVSPEILASVGLDLADYRLVVVKLGYLWEALARVAKRAIIALTPGATCENIRQIPYRQLRRPIFPLDDDFEWSP